jgi:hypothetical protein
MSRVSLFLILALVPTLAWAALGDTMAQSALKYGEPSAPGSPQILVYTHPPFRIWQCYSPEGHCVIAQFSPLDRTMPFTPTQCADLDRANLPAGMIPGVGPGWELVHWTGNSRGRNTVSFQYTGPDDVRYQVIVGQSREGNGPWYDDRMYLNNAGIEMFKSFGKGR